jgi:hypothetical protein
MKYLLRIRIPYLVLLATAAFVVSFIGATFSVTGLAKLFAGAPLAVMFMAGALEFAKVVSAGFVHQNWNRLGWGLKIYLSITVFVLMAITSVGIFGYLSHAYQKSSVALGNNQIQLDSQNREVSMVQTEINRMQKAIDEIPVTRLSKRTEMQKQLEPEIQRLQRRAFELNNAIQKVMLERQAFQTEVGPLVYVAEAFGLKMDQVARWFIFIFVCVFDPLAICLVIAVSWSIKDRNGEFEMSAATLSNDERKAA